MSGVPPADGPFSRPYPRPLPAFSRTLPALFPRGLPHFPVTESMTNSVTRNQPLSPSPTASGDAYGISKPLATGNAPMDSQKTQHLAGFRRQSKILDQVP